MDEDLAIAALKQGNLSGLEVLVERCQLEAVRTAYLITGSRPMAEDVVQAAFLKAAERIHQFKEGAPFRPWFLRIVANDAIKASVKQVRFVSLQSAEEMVFPPAWLRDPNPGPEELADTAEHRRAIWVALQQLAPKQRAAIVMRYFLDMNPAEISNASGHPLSSVKWSLHAAREKLRRLLGGSTVGRGSVSSEGDGHQGEGEGR